MTKERPKKRFYCLADDEQGRRSAGTLEAADEQEARRLLREQGYEIISLTEIRSKEKRRDKAARFETGDASQRRLGLFKTFFGAAVALIAIPAAVFLFSPGKNAEPPAEVVRRYLVMGMRGDFAAQYGLLTERYQKLFNSGADFAGRTRSRRLFPEPDIAEEKRRDEVLDVSETRNRNGRAEVRATIVRQDTPFDFQFFLAKEVGLWRINYARNTGVSDHYLDFLARYPAHARSAAYRAYLLEEAGFAAEDLEALIGLRQKMMEKKADPKGLIDHAVEMLDKMKERGMLTAEDYEARKAELLKSAKA